MLATAYTSTHAQQQPPSPQQFCLLVIRNGIFYDTELETYLKSRNISYLVAEKDADFATIMQHRFKGVILSGGPLLYSAKDVDIEAVHINFAALLNIDCPVLGICFGLQTIIELFGGKMGKMKKLSEGMQKVQLIKQSVLFEGLPHEVDFQQNHYDCSTKMPYNFHLIASSKICPIEGIQHNKKPIFGVQFHPEGSGIYGYRLLDNFLKLCGCIFTNPQPKAIV
jgi:GMP synthase (glutamine-hydrolysing)